MLEHSDCNLSQVTHTILETNYNRKPHPSHTTAHTSVPPCPGSAAVPWRVRDCETLHTVCTHAPQHVRRDLRSKRRRLRYTVAVCVTLTESIHCAPSPSAFQASPTAFQASPTALHSRRTLSMHIARATCALFAHCPSYVCSFGSSVIRAPSLDPTPF